MSDVAATTVQLRHEMPDGTWHIDWMLDLRPGAEARVVTFRVRRRIDRLAPGERASLERIADHRRDYLSYEGPVSGDRGTVRRLAAGRIEALQNLGDLWAFLIEWRSEDGAGRRRQQLRLHRDANAQWTVVVTG